MNQFLTSSLLLASLTMAACDGGSAPDDDIGTQATLQKMPAGELTTFWKNATIYFLLTDRFNNGEPANDYSAGRMQDGGVLRDFAGGDIKGITDKISSGYFDALGVDAIWTTPLFEQIHGAVQEKEYGKTYAYHGYWPKDWTTVDPNYGTEDDLREMIRTAHEHGIRVIGDIIINHSGPVTEQDAAWPDDWVRSGPACDFSDYFNNVSCNLAATLPDMYTEHEQDVELPPFLVEKWQREGRLEQEQSELDAFFERTGYPRAPRYYIVKWSTDWVRDYGIDGFRIDTAKHVEAEIWQVLRNEADIALAQWRASNTDALPARQPFFMMGEVFNHGLAGFSNTVDGGRAYDYGDRQVDFFDFGFDSLINMGFPTHAGWSPEQLFSTYSDELNSGPFAGFGTISYISSHDDMQPFDPDRSSSYESATRLILAPGAIQIYYGDELGRDLTIEGTTGDATLRSAIDWDALDDEDTARLLQHWRKLVQFRKAHPAVGAGIHRMLSDDPYVFSRTLSGSIDDRVLVGLELDEGRKELAVDGVFAEGSRVYDHYSGSETTVSNGHAVVSSPFGIVLLASVGE